ncbi:hypothetical protein [Longispora urticae]
MADYTDQERDTIRTATFGAMMLVSQADPGFFAMFKESLAGGKALSGASPELQGLFKGGGIPNVPKGDPAAMEASVLTALHDSVGILQAKAPAELAGFQAAIVEACGSVAEASQGTSATETAMIGKVRAAIGAP